MGTPLNVYNFLRSSPLNFGKEGSIGFSLRRIYALFSFLELHSFCFKIFLFKNNWVLAFIFFYLGFENAGVLECRGVLGVRESAHKPLS